MFWLLLFCCFFWAGGWGGGGVAKNQCCTANAMRVGKNSFVVLFFGVGGRGCKESLSYCQRNEGWKEKQGVPGLDLELPLWDGP